MLPLNRQLPSSREPELVVRKAKCEGWRAKETAFPSGAQIGVPRAPDRVTTPERINGRQ